MLPLVRVSSVTWPRSRADKMACAAPRFRFVAGARTARSGMGVSRIELVFRQRALAQAGLDRHIVESARREAAIEMPQPRNDYPHHGDLDVGAGLIEHKKIELRALREVHAGAH